MKTSLLRTILVITAFVVTAAMMTGCGNSKNNHDDAAQALQELANTLDDSENQTAEQDTLWNKKIRNEFYGSHFGESSEVVMGNFYMIDSGLEPTYADDSTIVWEKQPGDEFRFAGYSWTQLQYQFKDDRLYGVRFLNFRDDRQEALDELKTILKDMSKDYKMMDVKPMRHNVLKKYVAYCRNGQRARLVLFKGRQAKSTTDKYIIELDYVDCNISGKYDW